MVDKQSYCFNSLGHRGIKSKIINIAPLALSSCFSWASLQCSNLSSHHLHHYLLFPLHLPLLNPGVLPSKSYWGCAAGWGRVFATGLTIMGLYF